MGALREGLFYAVTFLFLCTHPALPPRAKKKKKKRMKQHCQEKQGTFQAEKAVVVKGPESGKCLVW